MSKSLRSIKPEEKKIEAIKRRLSERKGGMGYLAAIDAAKKLGIIK